MSTVIPSRPAMETEDARLQASFERWDEQRRNLLARKKRLLQSRRARCEEDARELRRVEVQYDSALARLLELLQQRRPG